MEKILDKRVLETLILRLLSHRLPRVLYFFFAVGGVTSCMHVYLYIHIHKYIHI